MSQRHSEHTDHTVHGSILPPDCAASVSGRVPVAGVGSVESSTALLHDGTVDHVLEGPSLFHQVTQTVLHYTGRPLVHFILIILCSTNNTFNALFH